MSEYLYVSFDYSFENLEEFKINIKKFFKKKCSEVIPPNKLVGCHVNVSSMEKRVYIEPFFGGLVFGIFDPNEPQPYTNKILVILVEFLQLSSDNIAVEFYSALCTHESLKEESLCNIYELMKRPRKPHHTRFLINTPTVFHFRKVEFELLEPFMVNSTELAIGYFCNCYVYAEDIDRALAYLQNTHEDNFIGYSRVEIIYPVCLPDVVMAKFNVKNRGVFHFDDKFYYG